VRHLDHVALTGRRRADRRRPPRSLGSLAGRLSALLLVVCALAGPARARPLRSRHHGSGRLLTPGDAAATPAVRYGALAPEACLEELAARGVPFAPETARGVAGPVRLMGPVHGVTFIAGDADEVDRLSSPLELLDCRLALALDDLAALLEERGIVEVRHYSMYRPPGRRHPDEQDAAQHAGGLALDAARFVDADGQVLDVLRDYHGRHDAPVCGPGAGPRPATPEATRLRDLLCAAVAARLFNVVLTPSYNRAHRNHFHLEVTAGVRWFLVH
jgi:hypothetical protein